MSGKRKQEAESEPSVYSCLQCSSKFKQSFKLTRHIKSVHTQDEFQCDQCASSFGRRDDLAKHKRRKHTLQKCEECEFSTYKNLELANHMVEMHPPDNYTEKSAFSRMIIERTFKVVGVKSPLDVFKDYRGKITKILKKMLEKKKTIKSYITMKIRMKKVDKDGDIIEADAGFNGGIRALVNEAGIDFLYELTRENIMEDFAAFNENGSGWIFERVVDLQLHTAKYDSINAGKYIPTPKFINHGVANIKNMDEKCFMWSIIAALTHKDRVDFRDPTNVEYYKTMNHNLKFDGITLPMTIDDIPKFEKMNDIPIAVYRVEENGVEVYPLYYTKRRDKDPINLLLIEGDENYHYAWIKNLDCVLMCGERQNDNSYYQCQCLMFRDREELIQPRWLLDERSNQSVMEAMGEEVHMDEELEDEIGDLLDMESDAFARS